MQFPDKPPVWLLIPARNEETSLRNLLPRLAPHYPVVVVDNGSTDGTAMVAIEHGAQTVSCPEIGYGRAVLSGVRYLENQALSGNTCVVIYDADGTSPIDEIKNLSSKIISAEYDLAIGQRTMRQAGSMPVHALLGNILQTALIQLLTRKKYRDMGSLRALRLDVIEKLSMKDLSWGWNVEMQIKAARLGLNVFEKDIRYSARKFGKSKISGSLIGSIRAAAKIVWAIFYWGLLNRSTVGSK